MCFLSALTSSNRSFKKKKKINVYDTSDFIRIRSSSSSSSNSSSSVSSISSSSRTSFCTHAVHTLAQKMTLTENKISIHIAWMRLSFNEINVLVFQCFKESCFHNHALCLASFIPSSHEKVACMFQIGLSPLVICVLKAFLRYELISP